MYRCALRTLAAILLGVQCAATANAYFSNPESAIYDLERDRYFITNVGSGQIIEIDSQGDTGVYYTAYPHVLGMEIVGDTLFVTNQTRVLGFNLATDELVYDVYISGSMDLNDITADTSGNLYITGSYDQKVYKLHIASQTSSTIASGIYWPNGILFDPENNRLLMCSFGSNAPIRAVSLDGSTISVLVTTPFTDLDGLTWDNAGNILVSSWGSNSVYLYDKNFSNPPELVSSGHSGPADIYYNIHKKELVVPNFNSNAVDFIPYYRLFNRVTEGPHVNDSGWSFGVSWVDYDGDDYPDIFVNNDVFGSVGELNFLYHNDGDGTYTKVVDGIIAEEGSSVASTWADFDEDGDNDVYVSCPQQLNYFYINSGDGTFTKATSGPLGITEDCTMEAEWVDYNNDGRLDLFVVNHRPSSGSTSIKCALYMNCGDSFDLQANTSIGLLEDEGNSTAWGDYDNDGDRDLFWSRNEKLTLFFDNNGDGTFSQNSGIAIAQSPRKYHGNWADYDNDGDLDLYTGAGYPDAPCLLENTGTGDFAIVAGQEISEDSGYWTGGYWGDFDNDGWIDLLVLGHYYYEPYPNRLYQNKGDGTFTGLTIGLVASDEEPSSAAAWADHDRDGDLDLFIANVNDANNTLYENLGNSNHWIQIRLEGTYSNRSGIGAKIRLLAMLSGEPVWQMREVSAKNGFMSQSELVAHFGLGNAAVVDSIVVEWPSGYADTLLNVDVNQFIVIVEGQSTDIDEDGIPGIDDNCPFDHNPDQADGDGDGLGNVCDPFNDCGDANGDEAINVSDAVYEISYIFKGGPAPNPLCRGDSNGDGTINVSDAVHLINYIFKSGPPPAEDCCLIGSIIEIPLSIRAATDGAVNIDEWA